MQGWLRGPGDRTGRHGHRGGPRGTYPARNHAIVRVSGAGLFEDDTHILESGGSQPGKESGDELVGVIRDKRSRDADRGHVLTAGRGDGLCAAGGRRSAGGQVVGGVDVEGVVIEQGEFVGAAVDQRPGDAV